MAIKSIRKSRAKTNAGRFRSLERRYFAGRLTAEEARRFEDITAELWRLNR